MPHILNCGIRDLCPCAADVNGNFGKNFRPVLKESDDCLGHASSLGMHRVVLTIAQAACLCLFWPGLSAAVACTVHIQRLLCSSTLLRCCCKSITLHSEIYLLLCEVWARAFSMQLILSAQLQLKCWHLLLAQCPRQYVLALLMAIEADANVTLLHCI